MQIYCKVLLLFAVICVLCGIASVFYAEMKSVLQYVANLRKLIFEDFVDTGPENHIILHPAHRETKDMFYREPKNVNTNQSQGKNAEIENHIPVAHFDEDGDYYQLKNDGFRHYARLYAHGDYSKLKLIVRMNKKDYDPSESIGVMFFVRNDSDSAIHINPHLPMRNFLPLCKLFHSNYEDVVKTSKWAMEFPESKWPKEYGYYSHLWASDGGFLYIKLPPNQEYELHSTIRLNDYYDLSQPDSYELTCFLVTLIGGLYYEPPLQSNTLTFRVLEEKAGDSEVIEEGVNPPKDQEVFKQPKPPINVLDVNGEASPGFF